METRSKSSTVTIHGMHQMQLDLNAQSAANQQFIIIINNFKQIHYQIENQINTLIVYIPKIM
ncbi:uncharacterized protein DS421_1g15660 [Arachis hypogaea]|nr:uncharacterized protein DS421_1g15660 [Arachis hypogaea]